MNECELRQREQTLNFTFRNQFQEKFGLISKYMQFSKIVEQTGYTLGNFEVSKIFVNCAIRKIQFFFLSKYLRHS